MKETREQWRKRLGLPAIASNCQQVIKRQDTGRAQQVQSRCRWCELEHDGGPESCAQAEARARQAPLDRSGQLAPIVIELDRHAAEMIVALREIFPHGEIIIKKGDPGQ